MVAGAAGCSVVVAGAVGCSVVVAGSAVSAVVAGSTAGWITEKNAIIRPVSTMNQVTNRSAPLSHTNRTSCCSGDSFMTNA